MTQKNDDHTRMFRAQGEYDDSRDFDVSTQQDNPETLLDQETLQYQESMRLDNLPGSDREGDHWVSAYRYEDIYNNLIEVEEERAVLTRAYEQAYDVNNVLQTKVEELNNKVNEQINNVNASESYNKEKEAELSDWEEELESRDRNFSPWKWFLISLAAIATILAIVFGLLWMGQRGDTVSTSQRDTALQEQVRNLQESLEQERTDHDETRGEVSALESQVDDLTTQVEERSAAEERANAEIENRNDEIENRNREIENRDQEIERLSSEVDALNQENDRLLNRAPETVTRTYVQRSPGETQTMTETATVTTTAPATTE